MFLRPTTIRVRVPLLLMGIIEAVAAYSSLYVGAYVVHGSVYQFEVVMGPLAPRAAIVSVVFVLSLIAMGLYQFHQRIAFREAVARVLVGLLTGCIALAVLYFAFPGISVSRSIAGVALVYVLILLLAFRFAFVRTVDENIFRHRTLVYGAGRRAKSISDLRRRADRRGFLVVGKIVAPGDHVDDGTDAITLSDSTVTAVALDRKADEIVVAMDDRRHNLPVRDLLDARLMGIDVLELLQFLERESGKIRVDLVNPGWLIFSQGFNATKLRNIVKRLVDIVLSVMVLLVGWPFMLLIAVAIKAEDGLGAPVLYRQFRVGQNAKQFALLKFRSMREDAEKEGPVWAERNDSRVTRVGSFLRKTRLDELPQLLNVLRGQMSIVGPRPERPQFVEKLQKRIPYYAERHTVKPGITGWAQLRYSYGASEEDAFEKLHYDLYYVKNHSLILDLVIILQTVEVVIWRKGSR